eukprot:scaffold476_cov120-Cylindrotheca_fusiformis.AAC.2
MGDKYFNKKDLLWGCVTKASVNQDAGLHLEEREDDGAIVVSRVDGIFATFTEIEAGHRLVKFQTKPVEDFEGGIDEINQLLKDDLRIEVDVVDESRLRKIIPIVNEVYVAAGMYCKVHNNPLDPDLNGSVVLVKKASIKEGRWLVETPQGKKLIMESGSLDVPLDDEENEENESIWKEERN